MEYQYSDKYQFTEKWFDPMIPNWNQLFTAFKAERGKPIENILEVGCYEGRATIFLCDNVLEGNVNYDVVDTFGGSLEEHGMGGTAKRLEEKDFIYENFTHNTSFHPDINFTIHRDYSQLVLPTLYGEGKKYDFIYIDASHKSDDTFVDAYYAHKMLNPGGLIIFDDFGWKDPNQPHPVDSPELGIRTFFSMYDQEYRMVMGGYQVAAIKKHKLINK